MVEVEECKNNILPKIILNVGEPSTYYALDAT